MNFHLIYPEFLLIGLAFLVLTLDFFLSEKKKYLLNWVSTLGMAFILGIALFMNQQGDLYQGLLIIDGYASFFRIFFLAIGIVVTLISRDYVDSNISNPGEYYAILIFTILASISLASSGELLTAYVSLEILSFGLYVLVAYDRYNPASNEGGVKFILLGAFSSALILYGLSQTYGLIGTTRFNEIAVLLNSMENISIGMVVGFVLILAGIAFKLAAVPFHMWAPDAYEGAPIPITAWLSVCSKVAIVALAIRFFTNGIFPLAPDWQPILIVLAVLTMIGGNLLALVQKNMKRLLAYSSIGHAGYLLMGLATLVGVSDEGIVSKELTHLVSNGLIFHMVAYGATNFAIFFCLIIVYNSTGREDIQGLSGLASRQPLVALVMVCSLFSLAGMPVFAGFTSKFYLFNAVASQGFLLLVGVGIIASLISLYYYLTVARYLYIEKISDNSMIYVSFNSKLILIALLMFMILGGVYPSPLMDLIQTATDSILKID